MKLYLDLDGVFADYRKGFAKVLGWDYHADHKSAWAILDQEPHLFRYLDLLPQARELLGHLVYMASVTNVEVCFLTALPQLTGELYTAEDDKQYWVRNALGSTLPVICVENWSKKKNYAAFGNILVDDSARNILDWTDAGGIGVLHKNMPTTVWEVSGHLVEYINNQ